MKKLNHEEPYYKKEVNDQRRDHCVDVYQKNRLFCTVYGDTREEAEVNAKGIVTFYNLALDVVNLYS